MSVVSSFARFEVSWILEDEERDCLTFVSNCKLKEDNTTTIVTCCAQGMCSTRALVITGIIYL